MSKPHPFARWPLLAAGTTLAAAGIGLDLAAQAPVAFGLWALAASCLGAFLYGEGARHREWSEDERARLDTPGDTPKSGEHAAP